MIWLNVSIFSKWGREVASRVRSTIKTSEHYPRSLILKNNRFAGTRPPLNNRNHALSVGFSEKTDMD